MKRKKRTLLMLLCLTLVLQCLLPLFLTGHSQAERQYMMESAGHAQPSITIDVCERKEQGSISLFTFLIPTVSMPLVPLLMALLPLLKTVFFLPINTNQFFHPPETL
ncbi:MAG: hypothetical protein D6710_07240 [Nitrospirae bacterium]|nr:MAG: hypothetical protein D6710_07240 [Nitrospirota bacterium]